MVSCCLSCSRERDSFVCRSCLTKLLKLYKSQTNSHKTLLPAAQARALTGIRITDTNRRLEARYFAAQARNKAVTQEHVLLKGAIDEAYGQVEKRRQGLADRRVRLAEARASLDSASSIDQSRTQGRTSSFPSLHDIKLWQTELQERLDDVGNQLTSTRQVLLHEILQALQVTESPLAGCKYQIASLAVPPFPELQNKPKKELNATLSLLVLLIKLVAHYLGIQLPFVPQGAPTRPLIRALSHTPYAARYPKAYPLYMSSGSKTSTTSPSSFTTVLSGSAPSSPSAATTASHARALTTGLQMLAYDAYYLDQASRYSPRDNTAYSSPSDHYASPSDILALVVDASCSETAGRLSHVNSSRESTLRRLAGTLPHCEFTFFTHLLNEKTEEEDRNASATIVTKEQQTVSNSKASLSDNDGRLTREPGNVEEGWDWL